MTDERSLAYKIIVLKGQLWDTELALKALQNQIRNAIIEIEEGDTDAAIATLNAVLGVKTEVIVTAVFVVSAHEDHQICVAGPYATVGEAMDYDGDDGNYIYCLQDEKAPLPVRVWRDGEWRRV